MNLKPPICENEIQVKLRGKIQIKIQLKKDKFANEDEDHNAEMPHCGSRAATGVECMPAGWPRPAPNTHLKFSTENANVMETKGTALIEL